MKQFKGFITVIVSAILFGLMPTFAKYSYSEGVNVISLLFYRYLFAFSLIGLYVFIKRINLKITAKQFLSIGLASVVGTVFTTYSLFLSYEYISTGLASSLHFVYPVITCILACIIYKEKMTQVKFVALLLSVLGIGLLSITSSVDINYTGIFWALISGLFYAIYIITIANEGLKKINPYSLLFYVFLITTLIFLIIGGSTNQLHFSISSSAIFYICNLGLLATFVAVLLFFEGMKEIGPSNASILSTFEPLTGVLMGLCLFNEDFSIKMMIGSILVLASVCMIGKEKTLNRKFFSKKR